VMQQKWKDYRRFLLMYRNSGAYICIAVFMFVLNAVSVVAIPYLNKILVDGGILKGDVPTIYKVGFLLTGLFLVGMLANLFQDLVFAKEQGLLVKRLKQDVMEAILASRNKLDEKNAGYLFSRIENDPSEVVALFIDKPIQIFVSVVTILIVLFLIFRFSSIFGLLCIGVLLIVALISVLTTKKLLFLYGRIKEQMALKTGAVNNILLGRKLITLSGTEKKEISAYGDLLYENFALEMKTVAFKRTVSALVSVLSGLPPSLILIVGGILVVKGQTTVGTLLALSMYFSRLMSITLSLFTTNFNWQPAFVSIRRICEILDTPREYPQNKQMRTRILELKHKIEFKNVSFSYDKEKNVLNGVSLEIPKGQITAIVGVSGAGKTTIIKLLLKLIEPSSGDILWDGKSYKDICARAICGTIGFVPQDPYLFNRTVGENILYRIRNPSEKEEAMAVRLIREFGLSHLLSSLYPEEKLLKMPVAELAGNISAGEKQRLAIIRELLIKPEILVWDEATANVDSMSERIIKETLRRLMPDKNIIIIAHRFSTVQNADNVIVLKNGRIINQGSPAEILTKCPHYSEIFADQVTIPATNS